MYYQLLLYRGESTSDLWLTTFLWNPAESPAAPTTSNFYSLASPSLTEASPESPLYSPVSTTHNLQEKIHKHGVLHCMNIQSKNTVSVDRIHQLHLSYLFSQGPQCLCYSLDCRSFSLLNAMRNFPYPLRWYGGSVRMHATLFPSGDSFSCPRKIYETIWV